MKKHNKLLPLLIAGGVAIVGLILLIVGIDLLVKANKASDNCKSATSHEPTVQPTTTPQSKLDRCAYSIEAKRSGLDTFLQKVQNAYYDSHPENIVYKGGVTIAEVKKVYKPYDPSPANLKNITDKAIELFYEIGNKSISMSNLKPREKKALYQVKHYLKYIFATPFDGNYYAGDFLMGPNLFCWQPICAMDSEIRNTLRYFRPAGVKDLELLKERMSQIKQTFTQYIENLKYGVKAGMVRSVEECQAGLNAWKRNFFSVALKGPLGIYEENSVQAVLSPKFISVMLNRTEEVQKWQNKYNKSVNESLRKFVLEYIGKPVDALNKYLENDHALHCVPSNVSSGLAGLPLSFIYENGSSTGNATTKRLPTGERLSGKKAYENIMPYFTTNTMTPEEVHKLGFKMLNQLYPEVLEIARKVTGKDNNDTAKDEFIKLLNGSNMYFTDGDIPSNESDKNAHNLCSTLEKAKKYCPTRWAAMQRWFDESKMVMSMLDPKTVDFFYFNGYKHTTPNCPVEMRPNFNPSSGAQSYSRSSSSCSRPSYYNIPFFLDRPGPKYEEWSVNAHEARPGHHTQVQGLVEHFRDSCGGVISWLSSSTSYTSFTEGWALYAENPLIARDTDTYKNEPFQKYGMLKWQVWRALRLIVDTGLHYMDFSRDRALDFFAKYAWDTSDGAHKEVTRYQSDPGQATAYMIGQLHIIKLRSYAKEKLGADFNLKDFHFYLLSQGSAPLSYLEISIHEYVNCTLNKGKGEGCEDVLNPIAKDATAAARQTQSMVDDLEYIDDPPEKEHPDDYF